MKKIRNFKNTSLKEALMKKNFPRSKSLNMKNKSTIIQNNSNIKTRNINKNVENKDYKDNKDNNYDSIDLDFDFNLKKENELAEKIYKANQLKIKEMEIEDKEINNLNEEIREIMLKNLELQTNIEKQLNMRYIYEKNQKSIANYINDLNYKFRNYDETISQNEKAIYKMKKENRALQNEYDKKIEAIELENEKLKKRIRDRIELFMHQKGQIDEKSAKTKNIENEIQMQKDTIKERVDMNKKKVGELEYKYDEMYKKLIDIEVNCEDKKIKNMLQNNLYTIEENNKENDGKKDKDKEESKEVKDIQQKIEDTELNNDALLFELKELNKQYEELTKSRDNSKDRKSRYSISSTMKSSISNLIRDTQSENKFKSE